MSSEDVFGRLCFYPTMCSANTRPDTSNTDLSMDMAPKSSLESDQVVTVENGAEKDIMKSPLQYTDIPTSTSESLMGDAGPKPTAFNQSLFDLQHHDLYTSSLESLSAVNDAVPETTQLPPSPPTISVPEPLVEIHGVEPECGTTNSTWQLDLEPEATVSTPAERPPEALLVDDAEKQTSTLPLPKEALLSTSTRRANGSTDETSVYGSSAGPVSTSFLGLAEHLTAHETATATSNLLPESQLNPPEEPAPLTLAEFTTQETTVPPGSSLVQSQPEPSEGSALLTSGEDHTAQTPPGNSLLRPQPEPALLTLVDDHPVQKTMTPADSCPPQLQPDPPEQPAIEDSGDSSSTVSTNEDAGSTFDDEYYSDTYSYTASLLSDVKDYTYENGRRYHSYREGHYVLPNDDQEQDRQDLLHHVRNLVLNGALFCAPLPENLQRVLDIGTGTGIWAIDVADTYPSAEVIGTDLSPIQPSWVPPNLRFLVDDAESPWLFSASRPFDFIHARDLGGAIADWPRLLLQAYDHLRPGGWIELQEFEVTLKSDDDSLSLAPTLCEFLDRLHQASEAFNRPMNIAEGHEQRLIEAGFEDVRDEVYKVPSSGWSEDPLQKQIGRYNLCSLLMAVESYSLALFTRVLGWSNTETQVFLAGVRRDLKDPEVHTYCNLHVVYGRKPWYDYGYRPTG